MIRRAPSARRRDSQAGFTLVETMVALFVFAILAAAGTGVVFQTLQGKTRLEAETARLADLAAMRAALKADLGQAAARPARAPNGAALGFTGGPTDGPLLHLTRRGWANPAAMEARSSLLTVEYRLEDGALVRTAWLRPDAAAATPVRERVLIAGVRDARIRFLAGGQWSDVWSAGPAGGTLPDAVELVLEIEGMGELRQLFLTPAGGAA